MRPSSIIRTLVISFAALMAMSFWTPPAYGSTVIFRGDEIEDSCITEQGWIYVALDNVAQQLGLTVLGDENRILIGNTINGTISIDPTSAQIEIDDGIINYEKPLLNQNERWFAPLGFFERVLGVGCRYDAENDEIELYPKVVSVIPDSSVLRITSSAPPDFQTFELSEPPRRVIDIENVLISGAGVEVTGSETNLDDVEAIRIGQFAVDPPVVRIVLEWDSESPPRHTLSPNGKNLSVMIGSGTVPAASTASDNLLGEIPVAPAVDHPQPTGNENQRATEPDVPAPNPPENNTDQPVQREWMTPDDLPEGAENSSLAELGWNVSFEMDAEGEVIATITTPLFETSNDFTLAGDGMRLVIDLLGTYIPGGERSIEGIGDIEQVRFAQFQPNTTRIVFDIARVMAYQLTDHPDEGRITVRLMEGDISDKVIVIDPGHGGEDPGAVVRGLMEKDINLEMAFYLKEFLEELGARVFLTRETDIYVTLANRIEIARQHSADLFVCIHNNATEEPTAIQGSLLLYNNEDYLDLYRQVHRGIAARTGVPGLGPVPDERGLYILRHAGDLPVVFLEAAFMTNAIDFARLTDRSRTYSSNIMAGLMDGLLAYYAGRELDPVVYPEYGENIETGVFDLAGRPIVLPDPDLEDGIVLDEDEESEDEDSVEEESDAEDEDEEEDEEEFHRVRGRGAYRYR